MRATITRLLEPLRALVPAFFSRFFENEVTGGGGDLRASLFFVMAFLAMPGFLAPLYIATAGMPWQAPELWGWDLIARRLGTDVLRIHSLTDKNLYLAVSMAATGLVGAAVWSSLLTDRKDAVVLGPLPVSARVVVLARLLALALFLAAMSVAMHALASFSFALGLSTGNTWTFLLRSFAAHFVSSTAGTVFVLLAVTGVQGLGLAAVGPRAFARVSPVLQVLLVAAIVATLAFLPGLTTIVRSAGQHGGLSWLGPHTLVVPSFWFLGLYETVLGTTDPTAHALARIGGVAIGAAGLATVIGYAFAYRRMMREAISAAGRSSRASWLSGLLVRLLARDAELQGLVGFALHSIFRLERQRFIVASAIGGGLAWGLPGWIAISRGDAETPIAAAMGITFALLVFVLTGLRLAMALPADLNPAWLFEFSLATPRAARLAAERLLLALGVAPIVILSGFGAWHLWGWVAAFTHLVMATAVGLLLTQVLLWRFPGVPCAKTWRPGAARIRAMWPVYLAAFGAATSGMASIDELAVTRPHVAIFVTTYITLVAIAVRHIALIRGEKDARQKDDDVSFTDNDFGSGTPRGTIIGSTGEKGPAASATLFGSFNRSSRLASIRETVHELRLALARPVDICRELVYDARLALRRLRGRAGYSVFAVVTIAIGIGSTATIYSILYAVLLKPLDIPNIDRVMNLYGQDRGAFNSLALSRPDFEDFRGAQTSFQQITAYAVVNENLVTTSGTRKVIGEAVDGEFFSLLGAHVALGRPIQEQDQRPPGAAVVVLSDRLWRMTFAADPSIIGQTVRLGAQVFEVVGVARPDVRGVFAPNIKPTEVWMPLPRAWLLSSARASDTRDNTWLFVKGRLREDVEPDVAKGEFQTIARQLDLTYPLDPTDARYVRHWTAYPAADVHLIGPSTMRWEMPLTVVVMAAVGILLLIATTNLANLNLARGMRRRQEIAVRLALGASRYRLMQEEILEAAWLAVAGGAGAYAVSLWIAAYFRNTFTLRVAMGLQVEIAPAITFDVFILLTTAVFGCTVVSGVWPAWRLTRGNAREALSSGSSTVTGGGWRGRQSLVAAQVAGSVVLLAVAAVFGGDLLARATRDLGFQTSRLAVAYIDLGARSRSVSDIAALEERLLSETRHRPGVRQVALASGLPSTGTGIIRIDTRPDLRSTAYTRSVDGSEGLLETLDIKLVAGRMFNDDMSTPQRELVISRLVAQRLFGAGTAIGRSVYVEGHPTAEIWTVTGVAEEIDTLATGRTDVGTVYRPLRPTPGFRVVVGASTVGTPPALVPAV
jgi:putative ABC transport system permease protein